MTIRVLVADDQAMIRGALAGLLDLESDIEVVAQAADGAQALEELARLASADAPARASAPSTSPSSTSRCPAWTASRPRRRFAPASRACAC